MDGEVVGFRSRMGLRGRFMLPKDKLARSHARHAKVRHELGLALAKTLSFDCLHVQSLRDCFI